MGVSTFAENWKECRESVENESRFLLAPLASKIQKILLDQDSFDSVKSDYKAGSIVSLVGKAAYPCVCEVKEENDSLFRGGGGSYVVSDGIKWQSVYLVISDSHMMLAEAVEDRIFELVDQLEELVKKNDGLDNLSDEIREEAVLMAKQTKALQVQYDDLVAGRPSNLLDLE